MQRLVLASGSPRRSLLLATAGYPHDVRVGDVDETLFDDEPVPDAVLRLSQLKVGSVDRVRGEVVLGADTMVVLDGKPLGKPQDANDARSMLDRLSHRTHSVLTGWTAHGDRGERFGIAESWVTFKSLTTKEINSYIDDVRPFDKAGAYALQGDRGRLVAEVNGSRANVMGLPLQDVVAALDDLGLVCSATDR
ncbi:MAG: Maf family nucleotide pyrophosphatase [Acidimicrobiia bacterium]|nr:MAG: Maf family nucleotide pyrophosphatase [Acidimicrobiia bacterium]